MIIQTTTRLTILLVVGFSMTLMWQPSASAAVPPEKASSFSQEVLNERATYGLPVDNETIALLSVPGVDVGSANWGIPLTKAEETQLDLGGRAAFVNNVSKDVLPRVRALPTFAGVYVDPLDNGAIVIMLTARDARVEGEINLRMPAENRGLRVVYASYTYRELEAALVNLDAAWPDVYPNTPRLMARVDTVGNRLVVAVAPTEVDSVASKLHTLTVRLGVPVAVEAGQTSLDVVCTNRNNCYSPYKAGIIIRAGSANSTATCTMGFHIVISGDEQCLTAGHCGCAYTSTNWYHTGNGLIGAEVGTLVDLAQPKDIMKIQMADAQASGLVYGSSGDMDAARLPVTNEPICASLGAGSNTIRCGTVTTDSASWNSDKCDKTMYGGDASYATAGGDSGSPVYSRWSYGGEWYITPIGVNSTAYGQFGRVKDAVDHWGATMFNQ